MNSNSVCWHGTPEEGRKAHRLKRCKYNNKDEVNRSNIISNNNERNQYKF